MGSGQNSPNLDGRRPLSVEQTPEHIERRFLGCLLGGAVGDALGAPVEFMRRTDILRRFGPTGIRDYAPAYGRLGAITDDTQMTLFTAEGLIRAHLRKCERGICSFEAVVANAYLRWLRTQGFESREEPFGELGWLFAQRDLHHRRAPGNTCLAALRDMTSLGEPAANTSKGCGGVMRVAPVGLFGWHFRSAVDNLDNVFQLGANLAGLTHGHPSGRLPAGVLAVLILGLTDGATLAEALPVATALLRRQPDHAETLRALENAIDLAQSSVPVAEAIPQLGQGWVAEEALAISVYCAMTARDFADGVIAAVNHDGDSDSTGAITGHLLGTYWGIEAVPDQWLAPLELAPVITELARDLYSLTRWDLDPDSSRAAFHIRIHEKYPPH